MKICFVTREYAHQNTGIKGGIGVFIKNYAEALSAETIKVTVVIFSTSNNKFNDNLVEVYQIKDLTKFNNLIKQFFLKYKLPGYISLKIILGFFNRLYRSIYLSVFVQQKKINILEFHDYGGDTPFFLSNKPVVVRCHGSARSLHQSMNYVYRKVDDIFEGIQLKWFNKNVIAVSKFSALSTQQAFNLKEIPKVIYNGVPINNTNNKAEEFSIINKSIFYFGSVRERKGIDVACRVFNTVIEKYPDATFHILGNNNNNHWEWVAENILSKKALIKTMYYGAVPNNEIENYLKKAHIVLFPSFGENFSLALLEVMALGKLVITSNIPAFKEIIEHNINGYIANSEADYLKYIDVIFKEEADCERMSKNARTTIENNFNLEQIIEKNIIYYNSVLNCE